MILSKEFLRRKHFMLDIETLGRTPGSVILSIAAVQFNIRTGDIINRFKENLNIEESIDDGFTIEKETVDFWSRQNPVIYASVSSGNVLSNKEVIVKLREMIVPVKPFYIWANSPSFDLSILEKYYEVYDIAVPWKYNNEMDVRTLSNLNPSIRRNLRAKCDNLHDPLDDCYLQIKTLKEILYGTT